VTQLYDIGDALLSSVTFEVDGATPSGPKVPTNPTQVTARIRRPNGTLVDYTQAQLTNPSAGVWRLAFVPTLPGVWVVRWIGTGAVTATDEKFYPVKPLGVEGTGIAYYGFAPSASDRDKVRLLVGDTNNAQPLLYDAEVDSLLTLAGDLTEAAIAACLAIAAKFARDIDATNGDATRPFSQRAAAYRALATDLRANAEALEKGKLTAKAAAVPMMQAGGISSPPDFAVGMWDVPGTVLPGRERERDPRAGGYEGGGGSPSSPGIEDGGSP